MAVRPGRERLVLAGALVDGVSDRVRRDVFLRLRDGVVAAVVPRTDAAAGRAPVLDLSGCVLFPALVDCGVRLADSPAPGAGSGPELAARHLEYCLAHGVLGLADVGAPGAECARAGAVTVRRAGVDFVRVACSADIGDAAGPCPGSLDPAGLRRALRRRAGTRAVVAANGPGPVAAALAAGCDAIEQGYFMGRENLERMADLGVAWFPSILRAREALNRARGGGEVCCRFSGRCVAPGEPDPEMEAFWERALAGQLEQVCRARELGVTVAVATGAGSAGIIHGEAVAEEVRLLVRAGYPLAEAVRCASVNGARFFGMETPGPVAPGRRATFIATRGTVGQAPRKLSYLAGVYIDGEPAGPPRFT